MTTTSQPPFQSGDIVFAFNGNATVITVERAENGLGESYWWVVLRDDKGEFGCDSRALNPKR